MPFYSAIYCSPRHRMPNNPRNKCDVASNICQALGRGGGLHPPRYLVLVPGKLLVMPSSRSAIPLAALSLAEGARVGVRIMAGTEAMPGFGADNGAGKYTTSNEAWEAVAEAEAEAELAVLEVTVRGRRHVFRMPSTVWPASWVGGFGFRGPGIHPNPPPESDPRPNPSESRIHFCQVKMPIQTVQYRKIYPCGAARNPLESTRIRPSTESVRIPNRQPSTISPL